MKTELNLYSNKEQTANATVGSACAKHDVLYKLTLKNVALVSKSPLLSIDGAAATEE